jgi:uncharacterized membrane protein YccC
MAAMTGVIGDLVGWLRRHRPELRLSLRTVVAGLLAFAIAELLALPQGYWSVFTAVLVVQASLGGSLKATIDRLVGTLGGAVCGAVVSSLIPHSELLALGLALAVVLAPLALLAALRPSFRVAPITGASRRRRCQRLRDGAPDHHQIVADAAERAEQRHRIGRIGQMTPPLAPGLFGGRLELGEGGADIVVEAL